MNIRIIDVDPQSEVALSLLRDAAIDVRPLYPELIPPGAPWPANPRLGPRDVYVVAYRDHRRNRIGYAVLAHLASEARRLDYQRMQLETGNRQASAMALYESFGFRRIPPFGEHVNDPTSVCYELGLEKLETGK